MQNSSENLWDNASFMPLDKPSKNDELLKKVYEKRQVTFIALSLKLIAAEMTLCMETGFLENFNLFKNFTADERQNILKNPLFNIWMKQTLANQENKTNLREKLSDLHQFMIVKIDENPDSSRVIVDGKPVFIERYEVDSAVMKMSSPEYSLPDEHRKIEFERNVIYPESFFQEMFSIALERIKHSWYEAYQDFPKFVHTVVDMIDGEYTSYSAAEHTGIIFVSTDNSPLVALEEFLMHEFGHQILYHVMELDPIVNDNVKETYKLPWSGNERDFYGYFHAFYIYILLARYLERVKHRSKREQRRISKRFTHIVSGLHQSVSVFENADGFTVAGRKLFENLKSEVRELEKIDAKRL